MQIEGKTMRMRKEAIEEYAKRLGITQKGQKEELEKIIKTEQRTIIRGVEIVIQTALLILVIYVWLQGQYYSNDITITQEGTILQVNGNIPPMNVNIEEYKDENEVIKAKELHKEAEKWKIN